MDKELEDLVRQRRLLATNEVSIRAVSYIMANKVCCMLFFENWPVTPDTDAHSEVSFQKAQITKSGKGWQAGVWYLYEGADEDEPGIELMLQRWIKDQAEGEGYEKNLKLAQQVFEKQVAKEF